MEEEEQTKLGFVLKPGTKWATAWAAAPAALAGFQAAAAQRQLGEVRTNIDKYREGRQAIENPFANLSNPYENLAVATQAAEMQAEETDIALANTLNTLQASGMGAGGATALAQAAAKSKQGVSASIEAQEADNEKLRAEGEQAAQTARLAESARVETLKGQGSIFEQQMNEERINAGLDRAYGESDFLRNQQQGMRDSGDAALMAGITGSTSALTSGLAPGGAITEMIGS